MDTQLIHIQYYKNILQNTTFHMIHHKIYTTDGKFIVTQIIHYSNSKFTQFLDSFYIFLVRYSRSGEHCFDGELPIHFVEDNFEGSNKNFGS